MPILDVAIYSLASLAASALNDEANATPSLPLLKEPEASKLLPKTVIASTSLKNAIALPETLEAQPYTAVTAISDRQTIPSALATLGTSAERTPVKQNIVESKKPYVADRVSVLRQTDPEQSAPLQTSVLPTDIFLSYVEQIRTSLPPGLVMRLPFQLGESEHPIVLNSQYSVKAFPSASQSALTVGLFRCETQQPSCLVGSFAVVAQTSIDGQREFKDYQRIAIPITLANNIQGYLLEKQTPKNSSNFSSVMWEQDNQFYTVRLPDISRENLLRVANSMVTATPIQSTAVLSNVPSPNSVTVATAEKPQEQLTPTFEGLGKPLSSAQTNLVEQTTPTLPIQASPQARIDQKPPSAASLLQNRQPILTTAEQLRQGEVVTNLRYRQSFPPGSSASTGLTSQPTFGISWGVTNNLELTLDAQTVDNSGPITQGPFNAQRINPDGTGPNFFQEFTLQAKQRLWQNAEGTQSLSGVVAASLGNAGRPFRFFTTRPVSNGQNQGVVTSLELPFTIRPNDRWQFTLSPKVAFLPDDNALYFNRPPISNPGSFGTTFGLAGGISYQINPRLILWGDAFLPLTGNNTINRTTGLPARTIAFNAGLRYIVNPRLATDLFVSNTLGNTGALSIVADRDYPALGFGVTFLPGITSANRRYPQHFGATQQPPPSTLAGFSLLDGGTVPNQQLLLSVQGGGQGLLTGFRYGLLDDLEIGAFLDNIPGTVDESTLGLSGKIRFLNQADGAPFTLSGLVTVARSNNVLINLINNNRNELEQRGLQKSGFVFGNEKNGQLLILTLSAPMHYQFKGGSAIWLTPTLGFVQRNGLEVAGFNAGGSVPLAKDVDVIAEAGLDLAGRGNAFIGNHRETVIPWAVGLRWRPASLLGIPKESAISGLQLEGYVTNRVGTSPFESLRVRADNDTAIGVGLVLPIQF